MGGIAEAYYGITQEVRSTVMDIRRCNSAIRARLKLHWLEFGILSQDRQIVFIGKDTVSSGVYGLPKNSKFDQNVHRIGHGVESQA